MGAKKKNKLDGRFPGRGGAQGRGGGGAGRGTGAPTTAPKVEMSAQAEARVRRALEGVSLDGGPSEGISANAGGGVARDSHARASVLAASDLSHQKLARLYDELIAQGFVPNDVRDALVSVVYDAPDADAVSVSASLDWLCFHLPTERLPRRYQGGLRTAAALAGTPGAELAVVNIAEDRPGNTRPGHELDEASEAAARADAKRSAEAARAAEAARVEAAKAAELRRKREAEETARLNREYIMAQYTRKEGDTDDDWDDSGSGSDSSDRDSLEDFGVDPAEVERRAIVRRRKRAYDKDPAAHLATMRKERDEAKRRASVAKACRDKQAQRLAGEAVRAVVDELASYGLTEDALDADVDADVDVDDENGVKDVEGEEHGAVEGKEPVEPTPELTPETKPEVSHTAEPDSNSDDSSDDEGFGLDLFGEDETTAALLGDGGGDDGEVFELTESPLFPPTAIAAPGKKPTGKKKESGNGAKGVKGAPGGPVVETVQPKSLLQMLCRREGWIAPRYERCDASGANAAGAVASGIAYTVVVERSGGTKRVGGGAAARAAAFGTVTCRSAEEDAPGEGGWSTVNDAQNAAAARALFRVCGVSASGSISPMPAELPRDFKAAWRRWAEEAHVQATEKRKDGAGGGSSSTDGTNGEPTRDEFVGGLLSGLNATRAAGPGAVGGDAPAAATDTADSWEVTPDALNNSRRSKEAGREEGGSSEGDPAFRATSDGLRKNAAAMRGNKEWIAMREFRDTLPIAALRDELIASLRVKDAAVVCGETGSGKTTQVPQYLLDEAIESGVGAGCRVICTQPRRVAALTVAERVGKERCERNGVGGKGSLVGHHVRLDAAVTKDTRLTFMTAGVLLRKMHGDPLLREASHVVLDEIHERSLDGDFLLALLRTLPKRRRESGMRPLKLVVMSATLDADLFMGYLGDCTVVSAPGRTHPVTTTHLEDIHDMLTYALDEDSRCCRRPQGEGRHDSAVKNMDKRDRAAAQDSWGIDSVWTGTENPDYDPESYPSCSDLTHRNLSRLDESVIDYDLIERLLERVDEETGSGSVLVFLPGVGEVTNLIERLSSHPRFAPRHGRHVLVPLHSQCNPVEQREAFKIPPEHVRKIVVATNVAETSVTTSVTIPDVVVVVDSGRVKERQWDPRRGMASLEEGWVSRAAARQRAGRAGRVRPGQCYALYTSHRHGHVMRSHQVPEMHRVPLTEIVLQIKKLGVGEGAESFLAGSLEPPNPAAVAAALATLREVGAIDDTDAGNLTPLGHHLATLPVDCRVAKMLVYAAMLSCLSPALTIAACLSYKSPFMSGQGRGGESGAAARKSLAAPAAKDKGSVAAGEQSDHLVYAAAYDGWARAWHDASTKPGVNARTASARYASTNGLSVETLRQIAEMRGQYAALLCDAGFIAPVTDSNRRRSGRADSNPWGWADDTGAAYNADARCAPVLKAVLTAGLYANVAALSADADSGRKTWRDSKGEVGVHPSSLNAKLGVPGERPPTFPFLVFHEKVKTSRVFVRDSTTVAPAALLLFGGVMDVRHETGRVCLDGWLWLRASAQTAVLYKKLRKALDDELDARIAGTRGRKNGGATGGGNDTLLKTIRSLLTEAASS